MTVLKRIRRGVYECHGYLVVRAPWINAKWDGPKETHRGWQVYKTGSAIERRLLLDSFITRADAYGFVRRQMELVQKSLPKP